MQSYQTRNPLQVEAAWRVHAQRHSARLRERAGVLRRRARRIGDTARTDWHLARANSCDRQLSEVAAECGTKYLVTACNCEAKARAASCGRYKYCDACLTARRRQTFSRMTKGLNRALATFPGAEVYLCTVTTFHSGSIAADLHFLKKAVPEFLERARNFGALGPYVYVYELTNGEDGLGHVHAHIALLARWMDYHGSADQWRAVSARHGRPGTEERKLQVPNYQRGKNGDPRRSEAEVASYLASHSLPSYLCKAEESDGLTDDKLGDWIGATYGKRTVITSKGFWTDKSASVCKCCGYSRVFVGFAPDVDRMNRLVNNALEAGFAAQIRVQEPLASRPNGPPGRGEHESHYCNSQSN